MKKTRQLYEFGPFSIDTRERLLCREREPVALTPKAASMLLLMIASRGRVLEKEELMQSLWPGVFVEDANLAQTVSLLRKALGEGTDGKQYIETIPRRGYRFVHSVREVPDVESEPSGWLRLLSRPWTRRVALALAATFALFAFWRVFRTAQRDRDPAAISAIAVLPFSNMSSDQENEYFADGLTEELIHSLMRVDGLRVAARTSSFQFKGKPYDVPRIAALLKVGTILEGSVRKDGNHIRITAQLINGADGYHIWSETYDRPLKDIFAVQQQISQMIVDKLKLPRILGHVVLAGRYSRNLEAYTLYLQGRFFWNQQTREGLSKAIKLFEQVAAQDPGYAPAYTGLADSYHRLVWNGFRAPRDGYPKALDAARRALQLDETLAEAHASMAIIQLLYEWDWAGAGKEIELTTKLNPYYAIGYHWASHLWTAMGDAEKSLAASRHALQLEPIDISINAHLGWHYYYARRYAEAVRHEEAALEMAPTFAEAHYILGLALIQSARFSQAIGELQKAVQLAPGVTSRLASLGYGYAVAGESNQAAHVLEQLKADSKENHVSSYEVALIQAALGNMDQAFDLLNRACDERASGLVNLNVDPALDKLRGDARFVVLKRKMGLK